jgi:aconitase B
MNKKNVFVLVMGLVMALPVSAQWDRVHTSIALNSVLGLAQKSIESAERRKEMEILARQKVEFEQSYLDAMTEAKAYEAKENWEEALEKYEEAAKLNCKYGYTDQRTLSKKISSLYVKGGREDDGPSILHNNDVTLADYSAYRYMRENPVFVNKKKAANVVAWLVPGSWLVRQQIIDEGIDKVLEEAGFELRLPSCSACLAMNPDKVPAGKLSISTSNRNFVGRQGPGARTILASPLVVAARRRSAVGVRHQQAWLMSAT